MGEFSMTGQKELAVGFLKLVVDGKIQEAYAKYVSPDFRHHNPFYDSTAEGLMKGMEESEKLFPNKSFETRTIVSENDLVVVHSHVRLKEGEMEFVTVHIFKFQRGLIYELWDIAQQIPSDSPNKLGMF
jgi:predicted SnoaL-like aldol condensation-catalyzing enzyme